MQKRPGEGRAAWAVAGLLLASSSGVASAETQPTLEERVRELERRMDIVTLRSAGAPPEVRPAGMGYRSPAGDFEAGLSGYVQADGHFFAGNRGQGVDTLLMRRVRFSLQGTVDHYWNFFINPDFGQGTTVLQDAFVSFSYWPLAKFRAGKEKVPFGLERLQSDAYGGFTESSLASNLVPNRDIGAELAGETPDHGLNYTLGFFNGGPDNSVSGADANNGKDLVTRVFGQPFRGRGPDALKGLGLGLGFTAGAQDGTLPSYKTSGQQTFFSYAAGAVAGGRRVRWSPQASYYAGPFGFLGELVRSTQEVRKPGANAYCSNEAWQAAVSWLVTGEDAAYGEVKPAAPFDPAKRQWGALELRARLSRVDVDPQAFSSGLASGGAAARSAAAWAVGVNWYQTRRVKTVLDFERTAFRGGAAGGNRVPENAVLARMQVMY